jgi:predicted transcriptional regulator
MKIITFRIEPSLHALLKRIVEDTERTQSEIIRDALETYLTPLGFERLRRMQRARDWLAGKPPVHRKF